LERILNQGVCAHKGPKFTNNHLVPIDVSCGLLSGTLVAQIVFAVCHGIVSHSSLAWHTKTMPARSML
jgi:hypothetical protein